MLALWFCFEREEESVDMSAAARFLAPRLWEVKMSSLAVHLEGRGRTVELLLERVLARREVRWEVKEREVEVEMGFWGARVGRGMP